MQILESGIKWNYPLTPINWRNIKYIVIHHVDAVEATPLQVDEWAKSFGWNGAGYNYYIRKDGSTYEMRGDNIGSQCYGYNSMSYGIGCEGDYENNDLEMPIEQYNALLEIVGWLKERFPAAKIVGHGELFNTACPGKYFPLDKIKNMEVVEDISEPEISESISILNKHSIIKDPSYWLENAHDSGAVNGEYMQQLIKNFVACYYTRPDFNEVLYTLSGMQLKDGTAIVSDTAYWCNNCAELKTVEGCWVEIVINRMAKYIQENS